MGYEIEKLDLQNPQTVQEFKHVLVQEAYRAAVSVPG